ncbi:MAG: DUF2510 domain-containing protein [Ilumatobacteraceae bacterium]|jgi:hypothetical protein|nr:DUF2510 domain-containing protein [Ilumatobacteraceae bacterium]HQY85262.1 DUF2510 domain-containing protein [Ilumatobacteraceae bacterium]HRA85054.1 DUF2510 domain-containing protein [Ilumatobacteraceae bacterium]HRC46347.1 DUF2510 domain-containing protein [Ilumatobacteraceae bacterium]
MTGGMVLLLWLVVGPIVCAAIASARGLEWWVGALLGVTGCVGLVIVCVMKTGGGGARGVAPPPPPPMSQWAPDPTRRHELRLWDGAQWTPHVSDQGRSGWDPLQ